MFANLGNLRNLRMGFGQVLPTPRKPPLGKKQKSTKKIGRAMGSKAGVRAERQIKKSDYNINDLIDKRDQLITYMFEDPKSFAATFYTEKNGLYRKKTLFSPYLTINDAQFCCLLKSGTDLSQEELQQWKKLNLGVCLYSKVKPLKDQGKQATVYTVGLSLETTGGEAAAKVPIKNYIIKVSAVPSLFVKFSTDPPTPLRNLKSEIAQTNLKACLFDTQELKDLKYFGSDEFTNEVLIGSSLSYFNNNLEGAIPNTVIEHYGATICGTDDKKTRKGVNFMAYADYGSLLNYIKNVLTKERVTFNFGGKMAEQEIIKRIDFLDIMRQIVSKLNWLQTTLAFTHGDLKVANILVSNNNISYTYKNLLVESDVTLQLADFGKSAITIGTNSYPMRLYNRNSKATAYLKAAAFNPNISSQRGETYYIIDQRFNWQVFTYARHMGIPYYLSYDTYSFIISLLLIPEVFNMFFSDDELVEQIWNKMWFLEDRSFVFIDLQEAVLRGKRNSIQVVTKILTKRKMKCNLTADMIEILKPLEYDIDNLDIENLLRATEEVGLYDQ